MSKYVFVTGGVVSSLGKGITAASLGNILKARRLTVSLQKLDPYLNVDPGTTTSAWGSREARRIFSLITLVTCGMTCTVAPRYSPRRSF
jgi:hypothetical protein